MHAIDRQFTQIINGTTQFVIPVFQRDYSWTELQCEQMWDDVLRVAGQKNGPGHFFGSFVYMATEDNAAGFTRWLVVDGQQRLTTMIILLTALRDYMEDTNHPETEDGPTPARIDNYYLTNTQESGNRKQKLVLRTTDSATLSALLERKDPPEQASSHITDNYEFFKSRMGTAEVDLIYSGVNRLIVVDVALDRKTDNPQLVFESLNSTGLDLTNADLVRNFVLLSIEEKEQTRLYEEYWKRLEDSFPGGGYMLDNFIRDYVAARTGATRQSRAKDVYYEFRDSFDTFVREDGGIEQTLTDMVSKAESYSSFVTGRGADSVLATSLFRVRRLAEVPALLIMRLHQLFSVSKSLSESEFLEALSLIESFLLRRAICRLQSRNYWGLFASMSRRVGNENPLLDLKIALARQSENYRFPTDEEFRTALETVDLYEFRVCKIILDGLENYENNEPSDTSGYSIEHIMPQNTNMPVGWRNMLGDDWKNVQSTRLHKLGNLTLTGYNSTYSDRPFEDKKVIDGGFNQSSVRLNQYVRERNQWTSREIDERTIALATRSTQTWPVLVVEDSAIRDVEILELKERARKGDTAKVPMTLVARTLYSQIKLELDILIPGLIELPEQKTVGYFAPDFFMELVPRKHSIQLLLTQSFNEIQDPLGIARNAADYTFIVGSSHFSSHQGGVLVVIENEDAIDGAMKMVLQSFEATKIHD